MEESHRCGQFWSSGERNVEEHFFPKYLQRKQKKYWRMRRGSKDQGKSTSRTMGSKSCPSKLLRGLYARHVKGYRCQKIPCVGILHQPSRKRDTHRQEWAIHHEQEEEVEIDAQKVWQRVLKVSSGVTASIKYKPVHGSWRNQSSCRRKKTKEADDIELQQANFFDETRRQEEWAWKTGPSEQKPWDHYMMSTVNADSCTTVRSVRKVMWMTLSATVRRMNRTWRTERPELTTAVGNIRDPGQPTASKWHRSCRSWCKFWVYWDVVWIRRKGDQMLSMIRKGCSMCRWTMDSSTGGIRRTGYSSAGHTRKETQNYVDDADSQKRNWISLNYEQSRKIHWSSGTQQSYIQIRQWISDWDVGKGNRTSSSRGELDCVRQITSGGESV